MTYRDWGYESQEGLLTEEEKRVPPCTRGGYTGGYTGSSSGRATGRHAQNSQQLSTRRDGRVVDGGGLENLPREIGLISPISDRQPVIT